MTFPVPDKLKVLRFPSTHGDRRFFGSAEGGRVVGMDHVEHAAKAADQLGFYGAPLPTGRSCEDAWIVASAHDAAMTLTPPRPALRAASALARTTQRLSFLMAVRPSLLPPPSAARMTATLDRVCGGRLRLALDHDDLRTNAPEDSRVVGEATADTGIPEARAASAS